MQNAGASPAAARRDPPASGVTATLEDVDIRHDLETRPRRLPNYEEESHALGVLAHEMATNPRNVLQKLVDTAAALCRADSAGISLLDGDVFRWEAVAGMIASARGGTMPRHESPCGVCIERDAPQLMRHPDRCFPALPTEPRCVEALLIPFHHRGSPVGTVWIVSHTDDRKFDGEDERIVSVLAQFASSAWQLWKACEDAEEASARKSDFLALLAHELRNPLAAVTTAAALIRLRSRAGGSAKPADVISRQCEHMFRFVDDLLDVARIEKHKLLLNKAVIDIRRVVAESADARRQQLEAHHHVLTVELGSEPIVMKIDPVRLTQMVSNLLDNAAKYTPDGGTIQVVLAKTEEHAEIVVRDSGSGVPAEQLANIFEPFTQLDLSPHVKRPGLGLGLPLVRCLAELHGGTVWAASEGEGQGSCFTVRLPIQPPDPAMAYETQRTSGT